MREIKFRAWDKKEKQWIANGNVMDLYYSASANCFLFDNDNYDLSDNVEFVQYTGLKDKNGKEIWESDIVEFRCDGCTMENLGKMKRSVIEFRDGSFDIRDWSRWETKWIEVIGNIYENPELLTNPL